MAKAQAGVVEGEVTPIVRRFNVGILVLMAVAVLVGLWRGWTSPLGGEAAWAHGLMATEVLFAAALILLGSLVEGFGFGLSLGTQWPYTRNIFVLMVRGDPEAAHRLVATAVGLMAVLLVVLAPGTTTAVGLGLIVVTALFGMGTLYVLAGRAPAFVHGTHGLLAYGVFLTYLVALAAPGLPIWLYLKDTIALHAILFAVFMGGMVTGQRGFGRPIGAFYGPQKAPQWVFVVHAFAALLVIGTLGWLMPAYPVAFWLVLGQAAVGFFLFQAVNLKPKTPGGVVAFHQTVSLLMTTAVVFQWR
ncbi:MAG: cytochrome C oxidase assembly protein [Gammaproteobacteria bacterium]|nr:cytochrome C oxidase assembly protein [Gammaproteobacteria bacterium]